MVNKNIRTAPSFPCTHNPDPLTSSVVRMYSFPCCISMAPSTNDPVRILGPCVWRVWHGTLVGDTVSESFVCRSALMALSLGALGPLR